MSGDTPDNAVRFLAVTSARQAWEIGGASYPSHRSSAGLPHLWPRPDRRGYFPFGADEALGRASAPRLTCRAPESGRLVPVLQPPEFLSDREKTDAIFLAPRSFGSALEIQSNLKIV